MTTPFTTTNPTPPSATADPTRAYTLGLPLSALPTPAAILHRPTVASNCARLLSTLSTLPLNLRAHIKTHKTLEATRLQLGADHHAVLVSTLQEAFDLAPLIDDGTVRDLLYGLPLSRNAYVQLVHLRKRHPQLTVTLLLDHPDQLHHLQDPGFSWPVFVKLDCGSQRAGLPPASPRLQQLVTAVQNHPQTTLHGFYAHAGHSYASTSTADTLTHLLAELQACIDAAATAPGVALTLSFGATPTAMATEGARKELERVKERHPEWTLELHAGCYAVMDLQQVAASPGVVAERDIALTILAEVVSVYHERGEALVNVGTLGLGREPNRDQGWGRVVGKRWRVGRISQEHGVLVREDGAEELRVGEVLRLWPNHACIAGAGYPVYYITDDDETVAGVWARGNGWNMW